MGNMREISIEECMRVSGGIIIVNGSPPSTPPNPGPDNTAMQGAWMYLGMNSTTINYTSLYGQGRTLSENPGIGVTGEWDPDGDDDGDGIRNMDEEIVVTAEKINLPGGYYAYQHRGHFIIMKDGWFSNTYQGTFTQGTQQDHDFVIKDSAIEIFIKFKFGEPGVRIEPGSERYFKGTKK